MLDILEHPKHPEYRHIKDWTEESFQSEYDLDEVNEALRQLKYDVADVTLKEILTEYSKTDLIDIAKIHQLSGYSKYKKAELAEFLEKELLSKEVMCRYFRFLNEDEIQLLESKDVPCKVSFMDVKYQYLLMGGYAGVYANWEDSVFCLPEEVKVAYRKNCTDNWKKECQEEKNFLMYFNVAAEFYGICPMRKVVELYKRDTGIEKDEFSAMAFLKDVPEGKKYFVLQGSEIVLSLYKVKNEYKRLLREQQGQDFYIPSKEEVECLGRKGYLPFGKNMQQLKTFFLKEGKEEPEDAEILCRSIQFIIRVGQTMEEVLDLLENVCLEYYEIMEDNELRGKLLQRIAAVWKETNTVVRRGNREEKYTGAGNDKIILFPGKKY